MVNFFFFTDKPNHNGKTIIHTMDCDQLPSVEKRTMIGFKANGSEALTEAKNQFSGKKFAVCPSCCPWDKRQKFKEVQ